MIFRCISTPPSGIPRLPWGALEYGTKTPRGAGRVANYLPREPECKRRKIKHWMSRSTSSKSRCVPQVCHSPEVTVSSGE